MRRIASPLPSCSMNGTFSSTIQRGDARARQPEHLADEAASVAVQPLRQSGLAEVLAGKAGGDDFRRRGADRAARGRRHPAARPAFATKAPPLPPASISLSSTASWPAWPRPTSNPPIPANSPTTFIRADSPSDFGMVAAFEGSVYESARSNKSRTLVAIAQRFWFDQSRIPTPRAPASRPPPAPRSPWRPALRSRRTWAANSRRGSSAWSCASSPDGDARSSRGRRWPRAGPAARRQAAPAARADGAGSGSPSHAASAAPRAPAPSPPAAPAASVRYAREGVRVSMGGLSSARVAQCKRWRGATGQRDR